MALPKIKDLILYVNKALTGNDWNTNFQKIVNWLTNGEMDLKVKNLDVNSVTTTSVNTGSLNASGNTEIDGNLNVGGVISGDGSGLTGVQSVSTIAYTPFTVNKGYIDTTENSATYGQEILMEKDGSYPNIVNFKVPITATTSDGVTFTLEQLDDLNVDNYTDGTYIVCIKKNQQRAELKMGVYRQRLAPTDNSVPNNTLWLDTSTENIQCYEKLNNDWTTKYDGVPIGEVVVAGGEVDSVKTYHYNWNGYNINVQETTTMKQRPVVLIESWYADNINWSAKQQQTDGYEIYSNGLVVQYGRISWNDGESGTEKTVPLAIPLTRVVSAKITENTLAYSGGTAEGVIRSISGGTVTASGGIYGNHGGVMLWEVKGYK
jgi:hypothetical protein